VRGRIPATRASTWLTNQILAYQMADGSTIQTQHGMLVESDAATQPGDSGAPVLSDDGTTLIGMNIYGGAGICFLVPAFALLATENYAGLPAGGRLAILGADR
jgi:hypothetical protein